MCLEPFDFDRWRFKVIILESFDHKLTEEFMVSRGYRLAVIHSSDNLIFVPTD